MVTQTIELGQIGVLDKISQGGQGVVYRAPSVRTTFAKSMVYKKYKPGVLASLNIDALRAMPEFLESLPYRDGAKLISLASWPCAIVEDAGKTTGFVMPTIPDEFFTDFWTSNKSTPSKVAAEFQHLLNDPQVLAMRFAGMVITYRQRYELLREAASALSFLHDRGICCGDISPKNLLFSLSPSPAVYFIDCDAMRVNGVSLSHQVETPGWQVPAGEEKATVYSDRYKLGLLALRLCLGSQDAKDPGRLPPSTPAELRQVITDTLTKNPQQRPDMAIWDKALAKAIVAAPKQAPTAPKQTANPPRATVGPRTQTINTTPRTSPIQISQPAPALAPSAQGATSSDAKTWAGAAVAVAVIVAVVVLVILSQSRSNSSTSPTQTSQTLQTSQNEPSALNPTIASAPVPPPHLDSDPDMNGESCNGYAVPNQSGSVTYLGRGSNRTSCGFARNVMSAYLAQPSAKLSVPSPSVSCPSVQQSNPATYIQCDGNNFLMTCTATNRWVLCQGGVDARVYLY